MVSNENDKKFRFLRDQPLQSLEDFKKAKFGHVDIAKSLADIVEHCDTPFTVGLFGKWGSGKSTIAFMVGEELGKRKIPTVIFDVWKHEDDFLRRSFLKELVNQLRDQPGDYLKENFELNERLESSVTKVNEGKFKINWPKVKQATKLAVLLLVALIIIGLLAAKLGFMKQCINLLFPLIGIVAGGSFLLWLLKSATQFLTTETTTFSIERLQDPHEFEKEFERIITESKLNRILIIFDNLDRAGHDKAVETLTTIKTFLEPKDVKMKERHVVFLIPCDDKAIKRHFRAGDSTNGYENFRDDEEFLRKFFNTIIWIPEFIPSELEVFAGSCLKEVSISCLDDPGIAWLITKAYRDNPRQIIQFINILVSNFLLIQSREGEGRDFETGFVVNKKKEICLYLLLSRLYPDAMTGLRTAQIDSLQSIPKDLAGIDNKIMESFTCFVAEVSPEVTIVDLRPYYALRRSDQEKSFPGIEELFTLMQDNKIEEAKVLSHKIENIRTYPCEFSLAVTTELRRILNPTSAMFFINSLMQVTRDLSVTLTSQTYSEVLSAIRRKGSDQIERIDPAHLHATMLAQSPQFSGDIAKLWVSRLADISKDTDTIRHHHTFICGLMKVLTDDPALIRRVSSEIKSIIAQSYITDLEVLDIITEEEDKQSQFISSGFVKAYLESINDKDLVLYPEEWSDGTGKPGRLIFLERLKPSLFDKSLLNLMLKKLAQLTQAKIAGGWNPKLAKDWGDFFELVHSLLKKHAKHDLTVVKDSSEFNTFVDALLSSITSIPDPIYRKLLIPLLLVLESFPTFPKQSEVHQKLNEFYEQAPLDALLYTFKFIPNLKEHITQSRFAHIFEKKSMDDEDTFDYFYEKIPKEIRGTWLVKLLRSNLVQGINKIKQLRYKIPQKDKDNVLQQILQLAESAPFGHKILCFEVCNQMKCNGNENIINSYIGQIKKLLCNTDTNAQKVGYDAVTKADYLEERQQRDIVKTVLDWLQKLKDEEKYQHYSLETIYLYLHNLNELEKDQLTQFCFDNLIRKSPKSVAITEGFRILQKIMPNYEHRRQNFSDVQTRYGQEQNEEIKIALVKGLITLRPAATTEANKNFWSWVDSIAKK
jgi:hypothetical protein